MAHTGTILVLAAFFLINLICEISADTEIPEPASDIVPSALEISELETRLELARLLSLSRENLPEAITQYTIITERHPHNFAALSGFASALAEAGRHKDALDILKRLDGYSVKKQKEKFEFARLLSRLGHYSNARKSIFPLLRKQPVLSPELQLVTADLMLQWGDFYNAENFLKKILSEPDIEKKHRQDLKIKLANVLTAAQEYEKSDSLLQDILRRNPYSCEAAKALSEVWFAEKKLLRSDRPELEPAVFEKEFLINLTNNEKSPKILCEWAGRYSNTGAFKQAIICFQAALKIDDQYNPAQMGLAEAFASNQEFDESLNILEQMRESYTITGNMPNTKLLLTKARVLSWAKQYDASIKIYQALNRQAPENALPLREAARVAMWSKKPELASAFYQELQVCGILQSLIEKTDKLRILVQKDAAQACPEALVSSLERLTKSLEKGRVYPAFEDVEDIFNSACFTEEVPFWVQKRVKNLLDRLRSEYLIQKTAFLEEQAVMASWESRFLSSYRYCKGLLEIQPGNQEVRFVLAQAQCVLGLYDEEESSCRRLLQIDPLHGRAGRTLERIEVKTSPAVSGDYSYWHEQSDGGSRLSAIERHHGRLGFELPLKTGRYKVSAAQHFWLERPGHLSDADRDFSGKYYADGQSFGISAVITKRLQASGSFIKKEYRDSDLENKNLGQAGLNLNFSDHLHLGLEYERCEELANGFSLNQGIMTDIFRFTAFSQVTRRLDTGFTGELKYMNDDNQGTGLRGNLGVVLTEHPRAFKVTLTGQYKDFRHKTKYIYEGADLFDIVHPYWTPDDYFGGSVTLQWRHDLAEFFFCGAEDHFYLLKLSAETDTEDNPGLRLEGEYKLDFADRWSMNFQGMVHRSKQWEAESLWAVLEYRF